MYYIEGSQAASKDSERYTVAVTTDAFYVSKRAYYTADTTTDRFPLVPGYVYDKGIGLPAGKRIEFDVRFPSWLKTPSGQDRFICDKSVADGPSEK